jgi:hypothetical protein
VVSFLPVFTPIFYGCMNSCSSYSCYIPCPSSPPCLDHWSYLLPRWKICEFHFLAAGLLHDLTLATETFLQPFRLIFLENGLLIQWFKSRKGNIVPAFNYLSTTTWRHIGEWRYSCTMLDLDTSWRWVVSLKPLPLYLQRKRPQYPLSRSWVGPRASLDDVEKIISWPYRD